MPLGLIYLLCIAIAPGIAISLFVFKKDKFDKEPKKLLLLAFVFGILSTIPAVFISIYFKKYTGLSEHTIPLSGLLSFSLLGIGLVEEFSKWLFVRYFYRHKAFSEPFDGIVYSVMVSMGFATIENVFYVLDGGISVGLLRMFISVPAHAAFAVVMGNYFGMAKFLKPKKYLLLLGLVIPYHGLFDFFLLQKYSFLLTLGAVVTFVHIVWLSKNIIKKRER